MKRSVAKENSLTAVRSKIAILGAGISGLACAYYLKKRFGDAIDLTILEKEKRVGGLIQTRNIEGFTFESGPRSIRLQDGEATLELINDLGLEIELLPSNNRYLLWKGKLEKMPSFPLMKGILPGILNDLFASKTGDGDESVHAYFSRQFSPLIADRFIDPLMKGIYAGDSKQLSIKACFPHLKQQRSLILGSLFKRKKKKGIITLKGGMEQLIKKLGESLEVQLGVKATAETLNEYDAVISTLPAYALGELFPETRFQKLLNSIPFSTVGVVHLGYHTQVHPYQGFGYLIPSSENEKVLGVIFEKSGLTVMIEGIQENLDEIAKDAVKRHLGISIEPEICFSHTAFQAIPQYPVGFLSLLEEINKEKAYYPNLYLLGTSFHGVSVNKAIEASKKLSFQNLPFSTKSKKYNPVTREHHV